jgi:hypothetical protein
MMLRKLARNYRAHTRLGQELDVCCRHLGSCTLALLPTILLGYQAFPASGDTGPLVGVRFEAGLLAENFAVVVSKLGRDGRIPNKIVLSTKPSPAEQLFRGGPIPGGVISTVLAKYLCDLNPHVCAEQNGSFVWTNQASNRLPASAQTCSLGSTRPLAVDELCLPDLEITAYPTAAISDFGEADSLSQKVKDAGTCAKVDGTCFERLKGENPELLANSLEGALFESPTRRRHTFIGKIKLPITGYQLELHPTNLLEAQKIYEDVEGVIAERRSEGKLDKYNENIYVVSPSLEFKPLQSGSKRIITNTDPPKLLPSVDNTSYLKSMNYTWTDPASRLVFRSWATVDVGIWDDPVDEKHCYFRRLDSKSVIIRYDKVDTAMPLANSNDNRVECGTLRKSNLDDHGTFVAGIVDGGNDVVLRLNPKANLWIYELEEHKLFHDGDPIAKARLDGLNQVGARVVNISQDAGDQGLENDLDHITTGPEDSSTLFVAAAGDEGRKVDALYLCSTHPACESAQPEGRHIISVVGLGPDGKDLISCGEASDSGPAALGTNYGEFFDVGALGVGLSSLVGNAFGPMCGSSVAAPYVTGLASLMIAKAGTTFETKYVNPEAIKERIAATADLPESLEGKVRYGRINFAHALAYDRDLLTTTTTGECAAAERLCSVFITRSHNANLHIASARDEGVLRSDFTLPFDEIRRIVRAEGKDKFRVIFREPRLRILKEVVFAPDAVIRVRVGKKGRAVELKDVLDFIPCSPEILHPSGPRPDGSMLTEGECGGLRS